MQNIINNLYEQYQQNQNLNNLSASEIKKYLDLITKILILLDNGTLRISDKINNTWQTNQWLKKAILLAFNRL